jgi:hypothetical protein
MFLGAAMPPVFEVDRKDLHTSRVADERSPELRANATRLHVACFALTSNNVTYAAFGDAMQYWNFFPADDGWGRVPVWGFADVQSSNVAGVTVGQRVYGYFPMATMLDVEAGRVDEHGFVDTAPHRQPMAGTYNRYRFTADDPIYDAAREAQQMILWPLFFTSFLIDDFIADNEQFGASTVAISSASSKTAIAAAYQCAQRDGLTVIGLTSPANAAFARELGCYDDTVAYDEIATLPVGDTVFVDIAGNRDVQAAVHDHYADRLRYSMVVGATHWDHETTVPAPRAGPSPQFFFAPTQIAKRVQDWGQATLDARVGEAWRGYSAWTDGWLRIERCDGPAEVEAAYRTLLDGRVDPRAGYVCSMEARR